MAKKLVTVKLNNHKLNINFMSRSAVRKYGDEIAWFCADAAMEVKFNYPEGSPFHPRVNFDIPKGQQVSSGVPNQGPIKRYRYTLIIKHNAYLSNVEIDPEVDVDGSGDPGGGKKGAKKKSAKKVAKKKAAGRKKR